VSLKPNGTLLLRDQLPPMLIESKPSSEIRLNSIAQSRTAVCCDLKSHRLLAATL
jgi:hypothetical protein